MASVELTQHLLTCERRGCKMMLQHTGFLLEVRQTLCTCKNQSGYDWSRPCYTNTCLLPGCSDSSIGTSFTGFKWLFNLLYVVYTRSGPPPVRDRRHCCFYLGSTGMPHESCEWIVYCYIFKITEIHLMHECFLKISLLELCFFKKNTNSMYGVSCFSMWFDLTWRQNRIILNLHQYWAVRCEVWGRKWQIVCPSQK